MINTLQLSPEDEDLRSQVTSVMKTRSSSYIRVKHGQYGIPSMHQTVMKRMNPGYEPSRKYVVDHINGDRSDNRRENLRLIDRTLHSRNRCAGSHNKSGLKGVCCTGKKYFARLCLDDGSRWDGRMHTDPREAYLDHICMSEELLDYVWERTTEEELALSKNREWKKPNGGGYTSGK